MSQVIGSIGSIGASLKQQVNPFVRLVQNATADDGATSVPYYQAEKIKEAVFQSDYGCEKVHEALMARVVVATAPPQQLKCLGLIRTLMLDGPAGFNTRMAMAMGKVMPFTQIDGRPGTVELQVKTLAQAIHRACGGDAAALNLANAGDPTIGFGVEAVEQPASKAGHKSDFQVAQEREQKAFKRRQDEQRRAAAIVVQDKVELLFDPALKPAKLVESAVASEKKKFTPGEVASFVDAAQRQDKLPELCAALDAQLKDFRTTLVLRFKALALVEALVATKALEVVEYFKAHVAGIQRHTTVDGTDPSPKAKATAELSQRIIHDLANAPTMPAQPAQAAMQPGFGAPIQQQQGVPAMAAAPAQQQAGHGKKGKKAAAQAMMLAQLQQQFQQNMMQIEVLVQQRQQQQVQQQMAHQMAHQQAAMQQQMAMQQAAAAAPVMPPPPPSASEIPDQPPMPQEAPPAEPQHHAAEAGAESEDDEAEVPEAAPAETAAAPQYQDPQALAPAPVDTAAAPAAAPAPSAEMMAQMQQQMLATQRMLEEQQRAFVQLQAQMTPPQQ